MNDKPNWQVARLDDIERRARYSGARAPRDPGVRNQRIHPRRGRDADRRARRGRVGPGGAVHRARREGDLRGRRGGSRRAGGNTRVRRAESRRKATGDGTVLAIGATPGEAYQGIDWGEAWPFHSESMNAYGEQRYADALEAVRGALERMPDHAGLHYNYACFATLAGDTGDDTFAHLRRSVELLPRFRETRAETTTSPPYATTRGSRRLFAERAGAADRVSGRRTAGERPRPGLSRSARPGVDRNRSRK